MIKIKVSNKKNNNKKKLNFFNFFLNLNLLGHDLKTLLKVEFALEIVNDIIFRLRPESSGNRKVENKEGRK